MLNLMKYEFRKNKVIIGVLVGIGVLLEIGYFISFAMAHGTGRKALEAREDTMMMIGLLSILAVVGFFTIFILGIVNYKNELNSKSSYLIFMTPNSSLKIILSKLLYVLIVEVVFTMALGFIICFDVLQTTAFLDETNMIEYIIEFFDEFFEVNLRKVLMEAVLQVILSMIAFFSIMVMAYCAITLSSTFLYNSRWRGFVSVLLFIVICIAVSYVDNQVIQKLVMDVDIFTTEGRMLYLLPDAIYYLFIMAAGTFACSKLIDKAINL